MHRAFLYITSSTSNKTTGPILNKGLQKGPNYLKEIS